MPAALLLALAPLAAHGQAPGERRLEETSGSLLVLADGKLYRERGGARAELGCTAPEGPGRVHEIAADPAGLTFVAAERGLFVLGPFVEVLDPVERLGGAPRGRPTSVHVDAERRVWLATDEGVGVLDPSHHHGRMLALDGLEAGERYRLRGAPSGKLAIQGPRGERVHDPAAPPAPRLTRVRVDGAEVESGAALERSPGGALALALEGEAAGGATFRSRIDGHHVWRELPARATLSMPHPGRHTLEVIAVDQDLDRSAPFALRLSVAYPFYYSGAFVLAAAGLGAVLALAVFLVGARAAHGRLRPLRALVSAGLALVLALQVVAGIVPHAKGWPFMGFSMYTRRHERDEIVYAERIVVLRADGSELAVSAQSAGVVVDEPWDVMRPMIDRGEPALRAYLEAWRGRNPGHAACGLQVQARRSRLTRSGPVAIAPLVLAHYREDPGG
jgi:hypothetical protein